MAVSTKVAPPNSLVLVEDARGGEIPVAMAGSLVSSTSSCVAVGCRPDVDGQTEFVLGPTSEVDPGARPIFAGTLETPSHKVAVRSVLGQTLLEAEVPYQRTMLRIWVNDNSEPDVVIVGIG